MDYCLQLNTSVHTVTGGHQGSNEGVRVHTTPKNAPLHPKILSWTPNSGLAVVCVGGRVLHIAIESTDKPTHVFVNGIALKLECESELKRRASVGRQTNAPATLNVTAPLPGRILHIAVAVGETVRNGASLLSIEAMKMENELRSPRDARVVAIHAAAGASVDTGQLLVELERLDT